MRLKNEMLKSPMEKVTVSEAKETGRQNLGSRPYHYAFWYTRFRHSFVLPGESTKFWNNYPFISISKEKIFVQTYIPTYMFMYNVLQESNFWPKTIRLTNAGTYNITH